MLVTRTVSCKVKNGTETYTKMVPRLCKSRWPGTNGATKSPTNCGMEPKCANKKKLFSLKNYCLIGKTRLVFVFTFI